MLLNETRGEPRGTDTDMHGEEIILTQTWTTWNHPLLVFGVYGRSMLFNPAMMRGLLPALTRYAYYGSLSSITPDRGLDYQI